jgi:hypothetical protein
MKIREEYELTGEDLEIGDSLRKGSLSVIDEMLSDLRKDDEYFIRFYPNEYSSWGNELFRDILSLLEEKEKEGFPFSNNFEKNNIHFYLGKLSNSEYVYTMRKTIQKILEIGRNLVEGCEYLTPYELDRFKRKKEAIMEKKMEDERVRLRRRYCGHDFGPKVWTWECGGYRECRICGEREEFYERD